MDVTFHEKQPEAEDEFNSKLIAINTDSQDVKVQLGLMGGVRFKLLILKSSSQRVKRAWSVFVEVQLPF